MKNTMREINKYIGRRIREAREDAGLSQKQLAKELKVSPMGLSHFETGIRPIKLSKLIDIARITKTLLFQLLPNSTLSEPLVCIKCCPTPSIGPVGLAIGQGEEGV